MKKLTGLFFLLIIGIGMVNAQVELPGFSSGKLMTKGNYTYCINPSTYKVLWTATRIYKSDIEQRKPIPRDAEFFPTETIFEYPGWNKLENQALLWAMNFDSVYVVTGITQIQKDTLIPPIKVGYKAILKGCQGDAIGFIISAENQNKSLKSLAVPIDSIEKYAGLDLFKSLNTELQQIIESEFNPDFWPIDVE